MEAGFEDSTVIDPVALPFKDLSESALYRRVHGNDIGSPELKTLIVEGGPLSEITLRFDFLYLMADELSRVILGFESLYNEVVKVLRGYSHVAMISPEERLRVAQVQVDTEAKFTFRGVVVKTTINGEEAEANVLELVCNILRELPAGELETTSDVPDREVVMQGAAVGATESDRLSNSGSGGESQLLDGQREEFEARAAQLLPRFEGGVAKEIYELAWVFPADIFNRRNLWGLKVGSPA